MATGATGQLGLALPVQGELSGTWGDTVNNGITQYTNIAIAATLTLTNDGAVTLANTTGDATASNITSSLTGAGTVTAQFAIVRVTGTLTTAKVVTAPSYSKTYTVVNAATGGIVTFKASGQTGVSIAVGESAFVYYNGTDYVKLAGTVDTGVTSFTAGTTGFTPSTGTTGAVTLAGTLNVANGGTGVTSSTGTGSVVLSASPTFTGTPLSTTATLGTNTTQIATTAFVQSQIGAIAAGVSSFQTSLSGLTPSTSTTGAVTLAGTLGTSSGGTNLTSFTSGGVVYASSSSALATGSALTFDGTNLGVGGTSTYKLSVTGSGNNAFSGAIQTINSNAGTGTQTGLWASNGTQSAQFSLAGTGYTAYGAYAAGNAIIYNDQAITLMADNASTGVIKFAAGGNTEGMRLTSTGLGIGTSSPDYKLVVAATSDVTSAMRNTASVTSGNRGTLLMYNSSGTNVGRITFGAVTDNVGTNIQFYTRPVAGSLTQSMILTEDGNLGIGSAGAGNKFTVSNAGANGFEVDPLSTSGTKTKLLSLNRTSSAYTPFQYDASLHEFQTSGIERMRISAGGNVSIGTTNANAKLSFTGSSYASTDTPNIIQLFDTGTASSSFGFGLNGAKESIGQLGIYGGDASTIGFFTGGLQERARINVAGGFSVGTTAASGAGAIFATGNITAYYSDARLKTVSGKIENALDKVGKLSGVYYTNNSVAKSFGYDSNEVQVGVLAQEVEAVLPQIVKAAPFDLDENNNSKSGENYKTVQYERLVPLLIEAINELRAEVKALKGE